MYVNVHVHANVPRNLFLACAGVRLNPLTWSWTRSSHCDGRSLSCMYLGMTLSMSLLKWKPNLVRTNKNWARHRYPITALNKIPDCMDMIRMTYCTGVLCVLSLASSCKAPSSATSFCNYKTTITCAVNGMVKHEIWCHVIDLPVRQQGYVHVSLQSDIQSSSLVISTQEIKTVC